MDKLLARKVVNATLLMNMNVDRKGVWDWGAGVALYGLCRYWKATGNDTVFNYIKDFVKSGMDSQEFPKTVNTTAPLLAVLNLYNENRDESYLELCKNFADFLMNEASRTANGALEHTVINEKFGGQMWVDTVFMAGMFLTKIGVATGDKRYTDEGVRQAILHMEQLRDNNTGLFYHGKDTIKDTFMSGCLWARGNSWVSISIPEIFENLEGYNNEREYAYKLVREQLTALLPLQRENGLWSTILTDPKSYHETSASAGFIYGMIRGRRLGYLDDSFDEPIKRGIKGISNMIDSNGVVKCVSAGTGIQETIAMYNDIPCDAIMPWGQGIALILLCEEDV